MVENDSYGIGMSVQKVIVLSVSNVKPDTEDEKSDWRLEIYIENISRALTSTENFTASVTATCELRIVAVSAINLIGLRAELFVDERDATHLAQEARFVPMFVFVAQVLFCEKQIDRLN
jgi:hypothetical protein